MNFVCALVLSYNKLFEITILTKCKKGLEIIAKMEALRSLIMIFLGVADGHAPPLHKFCKLTINLHE